MNLREIELFGTLMRVGTTIETARVLRISQAGVSAQLRRIEAQSGFRLFHRTGNKLEPTAEAHRLFEEAGPIFSAYANISSLLNELEIRAAAPVSVSATPAVVEGFLAPRLLEAGFGDWRQRLRLRVADPESDVRLGVADLGIQMAVPPKVEFQSYQLAEVQLKAVIQRTSPLAQQDELEIRDVVAAGLVAYDPAHSPMGSAIRDMFGAQGVTYDPVCVVPFSSTVCHLVAHCGGVGIIDEFTINYLNDPRLVVRSIRGISQVRNVIFHRREVLSATVQQLLHRLLDRREPL